MIFPEMIRYGLPPAVRSHAGGMATEIMVPTFPDHAYDPPRMLRSKKMTGR
jgi:hypothetical protein